MPSEMVENLDLEAFRKAQRADGPASILAIATANPPNTVDQSTYPDYYFKITNSDHMTELKEKFRRICEKSGIQKRHMYLTEQILKENPNMCAYKAPSVGARQDMVMVEVPRLGKEAAAKAIKEWGHPISNITHLVFSTTSGVHKPGADYQVAKQLGLRPTVKRTMIHLQGGFAGATVLRVAKDLAENNRGARVLVVCSELSINAFRGPSDADLANLVAQAYLGDGAAAAIVGADPIPEAEKPVFQLLWTEETILPDSDGAINGHLREVGLVFESLKDVPDIISKNIENSLAETFQKLDISEWNELFWIACPGGPGVLESVESRLKLYPKKLRATRHILNEYGDISSACALFVLDEMRKSSRQNGSSSTGEGLDLGVLFGFGAGLTVETLVLQSVPI